MFQSKNNNADSNDSQNNVCGVKSLLMLGMGSIQKALIELLNHEQHYLLQLPITCICPEDIPAYITPLYI